MRTRFLPHSIVIALLLSAFVVYQTTFLCTPRLFSFPKVGLSFFDTQDHTAALRGRPNDIDMRKHLLYYPIGHAIYETANLARILLCINREWLALIFPNALFGSVSVALAYCLFLRLMKEAGAAAAAAAVYAFTYSIWLMSSLTESYALTALCVAIFLCSVVRGKVACSWRWCGGMIVLVSLCCLCDLRSFMLLLVPVYLVLRSTQTGRLGKIGRSIFLTLSTLCIVAAGYEIAYRVSGHAYFRVSSMCQWLPHYGREFASDKWAAGRAHSPLYTTFTLLFQSISPLHQEQMEGAPISTLRGHLCFAYCFMGLGVIVLATSLRAIARRLLSSVILQGLICWVIAYSAYHIFYSPWSVMLFVPPMVLPLLLLVLPGIVDTWSRRRYGAWIPALALAMMLANNLLVINEARIAWQRPDLLLSPLDRLYLIPGEIDRMNFLNRKGVYLLSQPEKERLLELRAQSPNSLREGDKAELKKLVQRTFENLPEAERRELTDIRDRFTASMRLASQ
ncbi:MAG: hypothetical protein NTZ78_11535 [Candidatus Aureabacteria bacterium]|nr:hypothetical protein [Candidatus Auribacterota bacterium]